WRYAAGGSRGKSLRRDPERAVLYFPAPGISAVRARAHGGDLGTEEPGVWGRFSGRPAVSWAGRGEGTTIGELIVNPLGAVCVCVSQEMQCGAQWQHGHGATASDLEN